MCPTNEFYRFGGFAIVLAGLFFAAGTLGANYLISQNNSTNAVGYLYYIYNHGALLDLSGSIALLGIILFLPALVALVFFLKEKNTGYA